jgi:hypothetical protein
MIGLKGSCGCQITDSNPVMSSSTPKTNRNFIKTKQFFENRAVFSSMNFVDRVASIFNSILKIKQFFEKLPLVFLEFFISFFIKFSIF